MITKPLAEITEKELDQQVKDLASACGFRRAYHTYDSRRSQSGFPDLVLVRDRVVFIELKREGGKLSDAQKEWLAALLQAGAETYLIRPRHLDQLALILASRAEREVPARAALEHQTRIEVGLALPEAA